MLDTFDRLVSHRSVDGEDRTPSFDPRNDCSSSFVSSLELLRLAVLDRVEKENRNDEPHHRPRHHRRPRLLSNSQSVDHEHHPQ